MTLVYLAIVFCASILGDSVNARTISDVGNASIPRGYTHQLSGHGSYKVYNKATSWSNARSKCQKNGAHLAIINSREEAIFVKKLIVNSRPFVGSVYPGAWIGFRDVDSQRNWRTLEDESLDEAGYSHWWPKSWQGPGMCGTIKTSGILDAVDCHDSVIFICEYNGVEV